MAPSITTPFHIVINIVFIGFCFLPLVLTTRSAIAWWICMASVLLVNSIFHIWGAFKAKKYSPGVFTSIVLFIPVATYGYWYFLSAQKTTVAQALVSSATGVSYLIFSTVFHKKRARGANDLADRTH